MNPSIHPRHRSFTRARLTRWCAAIAACVASLACDGGADSESTEIDRESIDSVSQAFGVWDFAAALPINRVKSSLRICLGGNGLAGREAALQQRARIAVMTWVDAMRPTSTDPLFASSGVEFGCSSPHMWIYVSAAEGRASVALYTMYLYANDFYEAAESQRTITHEFGHIFGLTDTYVEAGGCQPGQPDSVMCGTSDNLTSDDVNGIQEAFCMTFPNTCRRRWQLSDGIGFCTGSASRLLVGDFDGDQRSDLLCHNGTTGTRSIMLANSSGRFANPPSWTSSSNWCGGSDRQVRVGDFNGDGRSDLLCHTVSSGAKAVTLASAAGSFPDPDWSAPLGFCSGAAKQLHIGKFNSDARADMLCHDPATGDKAVALATAAGTFTGTSWSAAMGFCAGSTDQLFLGNFNRSAADLRDDMLCHTVSGGANKVAHANADGSFGGVQDTSVFCSGSGLVLNVGDFNGDGRVDMLCHEPAGGRKSIAFAGPDGLFPGLSRYWAMNWCKSGALLQVGNFDGVVAGQASADFLCHRTSDGLLQLAYQQP